MSNEFMKALIAGLIRHLLGGLGFVGLFSTDQVNILAGAVATIGALAWSAWDKRKATAPVTPTLDVQG